MDLDLSFIGPGRQSQPCLAEVVRPLTEADRALLATERGIQPSAIKRLTDSHHALARVLAEGMKDVDAAAITGYTPSRISVLRDSPLFAELIEHYRANKDAATADLHERMATLGLEFAEAIREKLETTELKEIGFTTLIEGLKSVADRTGHGPQTKSTNLNVNVSLADRVREGRARAATLSPRAVAAALDVLGPGEDQSSRTLSPALRSEDAA